MRIPEGATCPCARNSSIASSAARTVARANITMRLSGWSTASGTPLTAQYASPTVFTFSTPASAAAASKRSVRPASSPTTLEAGSCELHCVKPTMSLWYTVQRLQRSIWRLLASDLAPAPMRRFSCDAGSSFVVRSVTTEPSASTRRTSATASCCSSKASRIAASRYQHAKMLTRATHTSRPTRAPCVRAGTSLSCTSGMSHATPRQTRARPTAGSTKRKRAGAMTQKDSSTAIRYTST
mmetsp:Transcript_27874/g.86402  ORF Transcript_27874/g.86402 Transcript_27874/m.86402 type:complete len:239 (+) Transcript_27874:872-1588(+)